MNQIKTVTVGQNTYHVALASAAQQKTLMSLIGSKITFLSASTKSQIDTTLLKGALVSLPEHEFDKVAGIVLHKTASPSAPDQLVGLDDFQCRMNEYYSLVAEGIKENLGDFFIWLDSVNPAARPGRQTIQPQ